MVRIFIGWASRNVRSIGWVVVNHPFPYRWLCARASDSKSYDKTKRNVSTVSPGLECAHTHTHSPNVFFCNFVCFHIFFLFSPFCALLQLEMFHIFMYLCHIICNKNKSIRTFLWKHYGFNADNSTAIKGRVCVSVYVCSPGQCGYYLRQPWRLIILVRCYSSRSRHGTIKRANWVLQNWQCL